MFRVTYMKVQGCWRGLHPAIMLTTHYSKSIHNEYWFKAQVCALITCVCIMFRIPLGCEGRFQIFSIHMCIKSMRCVDNVTRGVNIKRERHTTWTKLEYAVVNERIWLCTKWTGSFSFSRKFNLPSNEFEYTTDLYTVLCVYVYWI